jgi:hypothetical protein
LSFIEEPERGMKYNKNIVSEKEYHKYFERDMVTKTNTIALVSGAISLLVGIAQMLVDNLLPVIPSDKVQIVQQMQSVV